MPVKCNLESIGTYRDRCDRRKKQKEVYISKGISERKAEELLIRYSYKWM